MYYYPPLQEEMKLVVAEAVKATTSTDPSSAVATPNLIPPAKQRRFLRKCAELRQQYEATLAGPRPPEGAHRQACSLCQA